MTRSKPSDVAGPVFRKAEARSEKTSLEESLLLIGSVAPGGIVGWAFAAQPCTAPALQDYRVLLPAAAAPASALDDGPSLCLLPAARGEGTWGRPAARGEREMEREAGAERRPRKRYRDNELRERTRRATRSAAQRWQRGRRGEGNADERRHRPDPSSLRSSG